MHEARIKAPQKIFASSRKLMTYSTDVCCLSPPWLCSPFPFLFPLFHPFLSLPIFPILVCHRASVGIKMRVFKMQHMPSPRGDAVCLLLFVDPVLKRHKKYLKLVKSIDNRLQSINKSFVHPNLRNSLKR